MESDSDSNQSCTSDVVETRVDKLSEKKLHVSKKKNSGQTTKVIQKQKKEQPQAPQTTQIQAPKPLKPSNDEYAEKLKSFLKSLEKEEEEKKKTQSPPEMNALFTHIEMLNKKIDELAKPNKKVVKKQRIAHPPIPKKSTPIEKQPPPRSQNPPPTEPQPTYRYSTPIVKKGLKIMY